MQDQEIKYAGFWVRVGATIIDGLLAALVTSPLLISIYGWGHFDGEVKDLIAGPADFIITWVFPAIAVIAFWVLKQATPGKMAISAKVVDAATGERASTAQLIVRYFAYFISSLPLGLGFIWVAFDKRKQGWHDKIAGTVVIEQISSGCA